jgi:hypothetical protein
MVIKKDSSLFQGGSLMGFPFSAVLQQSSINATISTIPAMERSINPFDPELAIDWKTKRENAVISAKDKQLRVMQMLKPISESRLWQQFS